jgi:hypothetical protein
MHIQPDRIRAFCNSCDPLLRLAFPAGWDFEAKEARAIRID